MAIGKVNGNPAPYPAQDGLKYRQFEVAPFQLFMSNAVEALASVSAMEYETNALMKKYAKGKANIDDVVHAASKLSLAVSLATTLVSTSTETFKQIQQMPL